MKLEKGFVYHVFNRGNNGEKIFYTYANYKFFLEKIHYHILPFADVLSWCLMPGHFHLMIYIQREKILSVTFNQSIGRMLSSYAKAINIQEDRKGSLFQQHTKAVCLNNNEAIKPSWYKVMGITTITEYNAKSNYPLICMHYIHKNPVKAGIVMNEEEWCWSSYMEIFGQNCQTQLVDLEKIKLVVQL